MGNFSEDHKIVNVGGSSFIADNDDIFNGNPASDVVNLANWNECTFLLQKGTGAAGRATITVESCDDVTPSTATAIAFKYRVCTSGDTFGEWQDATASGFTTTAGANQVYEIMIRADQLSGTDHFVRIKMTQTVDDPCYGGLCAILTQPRFSNAVASTVLA